jgi:hypothetical protein
MKDRRRLRKTQLTGAVVAATVLILLILAALRHFTSNTNAARQIVRASNHPALLDSAHSNPTKLGTHNSKQAAHVEPGATLEVCGLGQIKLASADDVPRYIGEVTRAATVKWRTALLNSSDLRARAVGLVLQSDRGADGESSAAQADISRAELVQLAAGTTDPTVYALALGQCARSSSTVTASACSRLTPAQWARLDPDNAEAWISVAQAARQAGDSNAEVAAIEKAAAAPRIENPGESLLSLAQAELPVDIAPFEQESLATELIGYEAAWARPEITELRQYCSVDAMRSDQIHRQCNAVAELLVNNGKTLLDMGIGRGIGQRVGWPESRVNELVRERDALLALAPPGSDTQGFSCAAVNKLNDFLGRRMVLGELGALRSLRDQSAP